MKIKIISLFSALLLMSLTACSTVHHRGSHKPPPKADSPETVIVTYYVTAGQEEALQDLLAKAWAIYEKNHLVLAKPHLVLRQKEGDGQTRIVEILTWVNHAAPANVPDSITALWKQMGALCEPRHGYNGLDGGEVKVINADATR